MQKFFPENLYPADGADITIVTHASGGVLNFVLRLTAPKAYQS